VHELPITFGAVPSRIPRASMIVPPLPERYWQSSAHSAVWFAIGIVPDLLDVGRVAQVVALDAAVGRHRRHAVGVADGVGVARDRQHLAVGRHLLVLR
jgi:hypothetical protein